MKELYAALVIMAVATVSASAADATLAKVKPPVFLKARGEAKLEAAVVGDTLLFGDEVRTGKDGMAQVVFLGGAAVLVKQNSTFLLSGKGRKVELSFSLGEFLIGLTKRLERGASFRVRTPAATAAVRGTLFWGLSDHKKDTTYACFGHAIAVTAKGQTVVVKAGQTVKIPFGQAPTSPVQANIPLSYLDSFAVDGSIQGLQDLVEKTP